MTWSFPRPQHYQQSSMNVNQWRLLSLRRKKCHSNNNVPLYFFYFSPSAVLNQPRPYRENNHTRHGMRVQTQTGLLSPTTNRLSQRESLELFRVQVHLQIPVPEAVPARRRILRMRLSHVQPGLQKRQQRAQEQEIGARRMRVSIFVTIMKIVCFPSPSLVGEREKAHLRFCPNMGKKTHFKVCVHIKTLIKLVQGPFAHKQKRCFCRALRCFQG